ncbi:hypothetical protein LBMAG56_39030 [Verrucomicrobiota bacterium]|nr:hypothetical protein LBMAG56_39030 [Verrucomicrobiota bacterium]
MTTLAITLDDAAATQVQTVARKNHTTVERLFVSFVSSLGGEDANEKRALNDEAAARLARTFQTLSRPLGGKGYVTRDELYER